jgi:hypothetical protein
VTGTERLSLAPADKFPKTVVMLVDPRAAVHASTGILPVKSITLPPAQYADALKRIDATFLDAPVLGGANGVALPVPSLAGHAWAWLTRQADERLGVAVRKWATQDLVVSPNSRAAFSSPPLRISEGWLHLYPVESSSDSAQKLAAAAWNFQLHKQKKASMTQMKWHELRVRSSLNGHFSTSKGKTTTS